VTPRRSASTWRLVASRRSDTRRVLQRAAAARTRSQRRASAFPARRICPSNLSVESVRRICPSNLSVESVRLHAAPANPRSSRALGRGPVTVAPARHTGQWLHTVGCAPSLVFAIQETFLIPGEVPWSGVFSAREGRLVHRMCTIVVANAGFERLTGTSTRLNRRTSNSRSEFRVWAKPKEIKRVARSAAWRPVPRTRLLRWNRATNLRPLDGIAPLTCDRWTESRH
jgi:hypothetical protein